MIKKSDLKNIYKNYIRRNFHKRNKNKLCSEEIIWIGEKGKETFFGYHDTTPFNSDSTKILCHIANNKKRASPERETITIGYVDLSNPEEKIIIGESSAWNWQMGTRLQWIEKVERNSLIYNDFRDEKYISVIKNLTSKKEVIIPHPIYAMSSNQKFILTLNFSHLHQNRPGYGYTRKDQNQPDPNSIWLYDIKSGKYSEVFNLKNFTKKRKEILDTEFYINHMSISPNNKYFIFFLISQGKNKKKTTQILKVNLETLESDILFQNNVVSHFCWINPEHIVLFNGQNHQGCEYSIINFNKGEKAGVLSNLPTEDGHPMINKFSEIITDTYPDKSGTQKIIYSTRDGIYNQISLNSRPYIFDECRCDLHPRWSNCGKFISIDTTHNGYRQVAVIEKKVP